MKHLNTATKRQFMALMALKKMEDDFNKMSNKEKLELYEKYPDIFTKL